jgi:hypothetical protein
MVNQNHKIFKSLFLSFAVRYYELVNSFLSGTDLVHLVQGITTFLVFIFQLLVA